MNEETAKKICDALGVDPTSLVMASLEIWRDRSMGVFPTEGYCLIPIWMVVQASHG